LRRVLYSKREKPVSREKEYFFRIGTPTPQKIFSQRRAGARIEEVKREVAIK
jgi:hypothetical protein